MEEPTVVRLYYAPQTFPCGPQSSCCGPVGQSTEEVEALRRAIEGRLPGVTVEPINVSLPLRMDRDGGVMRLLTSFGHQACPIIALGKHVISMGPPNLEELGAALEARLSGGR